MFSASNLFTTDPNLPTPSQEATIRENLEPGYGTQLKPGVLPTTVLDITNAILGLIPESEGRASLHSRYSIFVLQGWLSSLEVTENGYVGTFMDFSGNIDFVWTVRPELKDLVAAELVAVQSNLNSMPVKLVGMPNKVGSQPCFYATALKQSTFEAVTCTHIFEVAYRHICESSNNRISTIAPPAGETVAFHDESPDAIESAIQDPTISALIGDDKVGKFIWKFLQTSDNKDVAVTAITQVCHPTYTSSQVLASINTLEERGVLYYSNVEKTKVRVDL